MSVSIKNVFLLKITLYNIQISALCSSVEPTFPLHFSIGKKIILYFLVSRMKSWTWKTTDFKNGDPVFQFSVNYVPGQSIDNILI